MGLNEILEISKPRIVVLLVITAVTSMFAASKLIGPELDYWDRSEEHTSELQSLVNLVCRLLLEKKKKKRKKKKKKKKTVEKK